MDENRKCDGHCERCNINQRSYCSAQMTYYNMQEIASIKAMLQKENPQEQLTIIGNEPTDVNDENVPEEENEDE